MFAIDARSLASFRIGVGLLLLWDLAARAWDSHVFLTDLGVVPRVVRLEMLGYGDPLGFQHQWSLHLANGQWWFQALLLAVAAWFAFWLLIGYRTQLAAGVTLILLNSLNNRNPMILDAGDSILRALLFWAWFLPLGAKWSVDAWRHGVSNGESPRWRSVCSAALLLQLAMMYLASAAFKWHPVWTEEFSAVYYALNGDTFLTPIGLWLREFPRVMQVLTGATLVLEIAFPLIAFSPWRNSTCRLAAIVAFVLFHLALACTLTLALFPWICIVAWLLFLPSTTWDWLERRGVVRSVIERVRMWLQAVENHLPANWRERWFAAAERPLERRGWPRQFLVACLFAYIVVWNVREILGNQWVDRIMPHRFNGPAIALGLSQNWGMFAPVPRTMDGWLIMRGTLRDGTEVNLWEPGQPLPWQKPALVSAMFPSSRWRRYLENIAVDEFSFHRHYFTDWLQRRWDAEQSGGNPDKMVAKVELIRQLEITPPPGTPIPTPETVELCVRYY